MSEWCERLTELRESKGLNQDEIASIIGIDYTSYNRYENGKIQNISRTFKKKLLNVFTENEIVYIVTGRIEEGYVKDAGDIYNGDNDSGELDNETVPYDILAMINMLKELNIPQRREIMQNILDLLATKNGRK